MILVSVASVLLAGCAKLGAQRSLERSPAPVTVQAAFTRDVPVYLDEIDKCVAREVVSVQPQVSGRITAIHFVDGADVKKGDPLFTIDPRPFQAQLTAAEATLAQTRAARELATIEFSRVENLLDTRAISRSDYDARKNAVEVADAQVEQGEAAADIARLNLDYCSIASPIDGRAGQRLVDLGNIVTANLGSLLMIQRIDPNYAEFTVAENDLTAVQQNMQQGALSVEVRLPDDAGAPREGTLTFLDNAVQEATGTVKLRATIENGDRRFWPGRFVKIRLVLAVAHGAVLVPAVAPQTSATSAADSARSGRA